MLSQGVRGEIGPMGHQGLAVSELFTYYSSSLLAELFNDVHIYWGEKNFQAFTVTGKSAAATRKKPLFTLITLLLLSFSTFRYGQSGLTPQQLWRVLLFTLKDRPCLLT